MENADLEYPNMLKFVLAREGGYVNNKNDLGGPTNKGITQTTYNSYRRSKGLSTVDVKNITQQEVEDIYYNNYYKASGADQIDNPRLALYVFDTAVLHGVYGAKQILNKSGGNLEKFEQLRREHYYKQVEKKPNQKEFLQGWLNRVDNLKDYAKTVLPQERELPYQLGVEMNVDENGNVIYYYNMDDYKNMDREDFKRNFPKIYEQSKYQIFHGNQGRSTGGAAAVSHQDCAGTYKVSGYVRSDGIKVSSYERTCGAKHLGPQSASDKYRGLKLDQMTQSEVNELLDELI